MTSKRDAHEGVDSLNPKHKMIFLGLGVWEELRILSRLARGVDPSLISTALRPAEPAEQKILAQRA